MVGRRHPLAALIFTDGRVCSFDGRTLVFESYAERRVRVSLHGVRDARVSADLSTYEIASDECSGEPGRWCLALFDDHFPTDSQSTWLARDGGEPRQVWCDYGTVGSGWAHRRTLTITNTTAEGWVDQTVAFELDTGALIAAGKLQGLGQD